MINLFFSHLKFNKLFLIIVKIIIQIIHQNRYDF